MEAFLRAWRRLAQSFQSLPPWARASLIIAGIFFLTVGTAWPTCGYRGCPDVEALTAYQPGGAPVLLDRNGRPFAELAPVEGERVRLTSLPLHVAQAFIAVEDRRFRRHGAVDWLRVPGAVLANLRAREMQEGFSTLTMQLARNVFPERVPGSERTLRRKLLEMRVAYQIEARFDKDEILELYLNHIYFGNGARGIEAAARHYFGKAAGRLALQESALLAALARGPALYDPRRRPALARARRDLVLTLMEKQGLLEAEAASAARASPLKVLPPRRARPEGVPFAPYFVEEVQRQMEERLGPDLYHERLLIYTTLDPRAQGAAQEELQRQLEAVEAGWLGRFPGPIYRDQAEAGEEGTDYLQGAVVVMEAESGEVLAWVGGREFRHSRFDRVRAGRRQAGSVFKPFVYATALAAGRALSETLRDEPLKVPLGGSRFWTPHNFDGSFEGRVSLRDALVRSRNVPTIRLADAVGYQNVAELAERAGLEPPIPREPSMALGTVAVSPLELTVAYSAFARLGDAVEPRLVRRVETADGERVFESAPTRRSVLDEGTAYLINDALSDALARGTGSAARASFSGPAAGKTGTTNDGADAWFVGYTPDVVSTVWIGFDRPRPIMAQATGGRLAAPVWGRLMRRLYQGRPRPRPWPRPAGVIEGWVDPGTGWRLAEGCVPREGPARREVFLRWHAPPTSCPWSESEAILTDFGPLPDEELMWSLDPEGSTLPVPAPDDITGDASPSPPSPTAGELTAPEPDSRASPGATPEPAVEPAPSPTPSPPP